MSKHEVEEKKPIYKKWWFWLIITLIAIIVVGSKGTTTSNDNDTIKNTTENVVEEDNRYQTSYSWKALEEDVYKETIEETRTLAVEIDDYSGIMLKAGTYKIYRRRFPYRYISLGNFLCSTA